MAYKYAALFVVVGAATILVTNDTTVARSGIGYYGWSARQAPHGPATRAFLHQRRGNAGVAWPAGGVFYGSSIDEPVVPAVPSFGPMAGDIHYTMTNDVPWDWVHRYPPMVAPSDRPYVPSCTAETKTFPGHDGGEQTVSITRCY